MQAKQIKWWLMAVCVAALMLPGCRLGKKDQPSEQSAARETEASEGVPPAVVEVQHEPAEDAAEPAMAKADDEPAAEPMMAKADDEPAAEPMMAKADDEPAAEPMMEKPAEVVVEAAATVHQASTDHASSKADETCLLPPEQQPDDITNLKVGDDAPAFTFADFRSNKQLQLSDFKGQWVVVKAWFSWCPKCKRMAEEFMQPAYAELGSGESPKLVLISLGMARGDNEQAQRTKSADRQWFHAFDEGGKIAELYGIQATPSAVIINPEGKIVTFAYLTKDWAKSALAFLRQECTALASR